MDRIKEDNKNLIALRNNYYTLIIVITSGLVWLLLTDINVIKFILLFLAGLYFDILYILRLQYVDNKINKNIERL